MFERVQNFWHRINTKNRIEQSKKRGKCLGAVVEGNKSAVLTFGKTENDSKLWLREKSTTLNFYGKVQKFSLGPATFLNSAKLV